MVTRQPSPDSVTRTSPGAALLPPGAEENLISLINQGVTDGSDGQATASHRQAMATHRRATATHRRAMATHGQAMATHGQAMAAHLQAMPTHRQATASGGSAKASDGPAKPNCRTASGSERMLRPTSGNENCLSRPVSPGQRSALLVPHCLLHPLATARGSASHANVKEAVHELIMDGFR
jgi:hypothetical protein